MRQYCKDNSIEGFNITSAGIDMAPTRDYPIVEKTLRKLGVGFRLHKPKKATRNLLERSDIIIALSTKHKKFIKSNFGLDAVLFNQISRGIQSSVKDVDEVILDYMTNTISVDIFMEKIINYIHECVPSIVKNVKKLE